MNNPKILDLALAFIFHRHPTANKAQAIRNLSDDELAALLYEIVAQQDIALAQSMVGRNGCRRR